MSRESPLCNFAIVQLGPLEESVPVILDQVRGGGRGLLAFWKPISASREQYYYCVLCTVPTECCALHVLLYFIFIKSLCLLWLMAGEAEAAQTD